MNEKIKVKLLSEIRLGKNGVKRNFSIITPVLSLIVDYFIVIMFTSRLPPLDFISKLVFDKYR
jgi:hypothetical protein